MIQRLVDFALRHRITVFAAAALLVLLGVSAFLRVPIEAYPDVGDTQVQVITQWPGHAAEEIERQVSIPMERVLNATPRQVSVRSVSIAGLSVVTVTFDEGVNDYFARAQVLERIPQVDLPDGVQPTLGPLASPIGEILRYRLVNCSEHWTDECTAADRGAEARPLSELKDLEEWVVERELLRTDGVADVASFGGTVKQFQVLVDPSRLAARGLGLDDVTAALRRANGSSGGGVMAFGPASLNVRGIGLLRPDEIADVSIVERAGTPIRIRDVATVAVGYQPRMGRVSLDADDDVVAATVLLRRGDDAQTVLRRLHTRIDDLNARVLPRGVKLHPYHDRTHLMELTTHTVLENLLAGVSLVVLILFVFLGNTRAAVIVALTIPLSLLSAFVGMSAMSIPANLLSIGAVDFGMIVDGSIVMVENIFRLLAERHGLRKPAEIVRLIRGAAREVARPIVFAIAIIIAAYLPIFSLQSVEGRLFRPMAWTVGFALLGALVLAVTLVPALAAVLFRGELKEFHNPFLEQIRRFHRPALASLLRRPRVLIPVAMVLLLGEAVLYRSAGSEFLPHLNEGALWVRASMPGNISLEEAERLVDGTDTPTGHVRGMREILRGFPEIETLAVQLGRPDDGMDPSGFYNAEFLMVLKDRAQCRPQFHGDREAFENAVSTALRVVPGVTFGISQPISDNVEEALTGVKGQLAVKIVGDDLHALDDLATRIAHEIGGVAGVADLGIFREVGQSNAHVEIRRREAERVGVTVSDVEDVVEAGVGGIPVTSIVEGERRHDLVVRFRESARNSLDALRRIAVPTDSGHIVPLGQVANVEVEGGASRIFRENGRRYVAIKFSVRGRDLGSTVAEAQGRVASVLRTPPPGYEITWGGEFESARRAAARLSYMIPLTILVIFGLLYAMFRRPQEALLILGNVLLTSPLGGLAALHLSDTPLSVSAGVGFLALAGVSVQTGVILVSYVNELRAAGASLDEALVAATDLRLRPMMMTALVATLGLVPAAVSHGIGSDSQKPLAIVVVGGLLSSIALSIFTLPVLYRLFPPATPGTPTPDPDDADDADARHEGVPQ